MGWASGEGRVVTMKWVRANIKTGARLALFALALQFTFSFGHFHAIAAQTAPSIQSAQQQLPAPDSGQHPDDLCAICVVTALAGTALAAASPALPLLQAVELPRQAMDTTVFRVHAPRAAFQSRAPPLL
jgi:hypothetical protein